MSSTYNRARKQQPTTFIHPTNPIKTAMVGWIAIDQVIRIQKFMSSFKPIEPDEAHNSIIEQSQGVFNINHPIIESVIAISTRRLSFFQLISDTHMSQDPFLSPSPNPRDLTILTKLNKKKKKARHTKYLRELGNLES